MSIKVNQLLYFLEIDIFRYITMNTDSHSTICLPIPIFNHISMIDCKWHDVEVFRHSFFVISPGFENLTPLVIDLCRLIWLYKGTQKTWTKVLYTLNCVILNFILNVMFNFVGLYTFPCACILVHIVVILMFSHDNAFYSDQIEPNKYYPFSYYYSPFRT